MRLFVAVYPPLDVARRLLTMLDSLQLPEHTLTAPEQIHITMLFLGDRRVSELESVRESVAASCRGLRACLVHIERLVLLPEQGPARLIAVETDLPPSLAEMHRRLVRRLAHRGHRDAESFLPHLTLCRFKGSGASLRPELPSQLPDQTVFEATSVRLVRSVLHPRGARHEPIADWPLA